MKVEQGMPRKSVTFSSFLLLCIVISSFNFFSFNSIAEKTDDMMVPETVGWYRIILPDELITPVSATLVLSFEVDQIANISATINAAYYQLFNLNNTEIYNKTARIETYAPALHYLEFNHTTTGEEAYFRITINASRNDAPASYVYFTTNKHNIKIDNSLLAPTITSIEPFNYTQYLNVNTNKTFIINAIDANNDTLLYYWKLDGVNCTVNASQNYYVLHVNESLYGVVHNLTVYITDGKSELERSWEIRIVNPNDTIQIYIGGDGGTHIELENIPPELLGSQVSVEVLSQTGLISGTSTRVDGNKISIPIYPGSGDGEHTINIYFNQTLYKSLKFGVPDPLILIVNRTPVFLGESIEVTAKTRNLTGTLNLKIMNSPGQIIRENFTGQLIQVMRDYKNYTNIVENITIDINPNGTTTYAWNTTQISPDFYLIYLGSNDTLYRTAHPIIIFPPLPTIDKIEYAPLDMTKGDNVSFGLFINNTWKYPRLIGVRLLVDGVDTSSAITTLNARSVSTIALNWTATYGNHTFGIEVLDAVNTGGGNYTNVAKGGYVLGIVNETKGFYPRDIINTTGHILTINVSVKSTNHAPIFLQGPSALRTNITTNFTYQIQALDLDGDPIFYRLNTTLLSINSTGYVSGRIQKSGTYTIRVILNDTKEENFTEFVLIVEDVALPLPKTTTETERGLTQLQFVFIGIIAICMTSTTLFIVFTESGMFGFLCIFMPLFVKLKKEKALNHFLRGQIYGVIREYPGAHYNYIRHKLKLGNGALTHHLYTLEREGFIIHKQDGIRKKFYSTDASIASPEYNNFENEQSSSDSNIENGIQFSAIQEKILQTIKETPGISQMDIVVKTKLSKQIVSYNVKRLCERGIILVKNEGWGRRFMGCYINNL